MLTDRERKILAVLAADGGYTTGQVADKVMSMFCGNSRQRSHAVRAWLLRLESQGLVKRLDDPEGQGRILVEFPWMADGQRSMWAPVAAAMAGGNRGAFFMPDFVPSASVET